jgi:uncharacterized protein YjaG (DUF416 family)
MTNKEIDLVERLLLKRAIGGAVTSNEEREIAAVLGENYLDRLVYRDLLEVAMSDLHCIKEMRPDLGDAEVAFLVRTADDDEDAEMWMQRVMRFDPSYAEQA